MTLAPLAFPNLLRTFELVVVGQPALFLFCTSTWSVVGGSDPFGETPCMSCSVTACMGGAQSGRFTTKDKSFREWDRALGPNGEDMLPGCRENGGQW